jgi:hypothetical protein
MVMDGTGSGMVRPRISGGPWTGPEVGVDGFADVTDSVRDVVGIFDRLVNEAVQGTPGGLVTLHLEKLLAGGLEADSGRGGIAWGPFRLDNAEPRVRLAVPFAALLTDARRDRRVAGAEAIGVLLAGRRLDLSERGRLIGLPPGGCAVIGCLVSAAVAGCR